MVGNLAVTTMNISAIFINRPVMTSLVMAAFVLAGIYGYASLPVSELPQVDFPTIDINASFPGADATTMAAAVATPLEKQFSLISGMDSMTSQNALGTSRITLQFRLDGTSTQRPWMYKQRCPRRHASFRLRC